ncbi:MAG: hypothetical protein KC766_06550 [Myxococcales bacterium]|nr:hypothetical protein [Myxococcales bacterium]
MTDEGALPIELLKTGSSATSGVEDWVTTYDIPVTTVKPKAGVDPNTTILARRATAYVIRLETMEIVFKFEGSLAGIGDSAAKVAIEEFEAKYR